MFPVFVTVIVYSITSPGLTITFFKSSISTNSVLPFDFIAVAFFSRTSIASSYFVTSSASTRLFNFAEISVEPAGVSERVTYTLLP